MSRNGKPSEVVGLGGVPVVAACVNHVPLLCVYLLAGPGLVGGLLGCDDMGLEKFLCFSSVSATFDSALECRDLLGGAMLARLSTLAALLPFVGVGDIMRCIGSRLEDR